MHRRPPSPAPIARAALVAVAVVFAVAALVTAGASTVAWAPGADASVRAPSSEPLPPPSAAATAAEDPVAGSPAEPTTVPADESGIGGLDTGSNTPSPRGEPEPPRAQRVADTVIFVGLLVVFAAGVGVAIWSVRRSRPAT